MEPIIHHHNTVQGYELLYFENAQIEKVKGNSVSFAGMGTLSVCYFKPYDRYVLMLNDWKYPLLRRLPIMAEGSEQTHRCYILPAENGFSYRLNLNHIPCMRALGNLEKILSSNSNFSYRGVESPFWKCDISPDDELIRHEKKDTGIKEIVKGTVKRGMERARIHVETLKTGTVGLQSRKKALNLKELRNRNYKKRAQCTFHKGFFDAGMEMTDEFVKYRTMNINMIEDRNLLQLKICYEKPIVYVNKEEIEDKILSLRNIATKGNIQLSGFQLRLPRQVEEERGRGKAPGRNLGFVASLKQGLREIKDSFSGMLSGPHIDDSATGGQRERPRHVNPQAQDPLMASLETMEHYQG